MVKPAGKRRQVDGLVERFRVSRRRVCGLLLFCRAAFYYRAHRPDDTPLRARLRELAQARQPWGYQRRHILLRHEGWLVNKKRTHRIYMEEGLSVRTKARKKRGSHLRSCRHRRQQRTSGGPWTSCSARSSQSIPR
jgi:putative transposase